MKKNRTRPLLDLRVEPDDKILIVGKTGCGKSTLVRYLTDQIKRFIIYDTGGEYGDLAPEIRSLFELFDYIECREPRLSYFTDEDEEFNQVCRILYALEDIFFIVDEVDNFCKPQEIPEYFKRLIRYGRKYKIGLIAVTRRVAEINRLLSSQATKIISFSQHEPRDIEYLRSIIPHAEQILELPMFHFLYYNVLTHRTRIMQLPGKYKC